MSVRLPGLGGFQGFSRPLIEREFYFFGAHKYSVPRSVGQATKGKNVKIGIAIFSTPFSTFCSSYIYSYNFKELRYLQMLSSLLTFRFIFTSGDRERSLLTQIQEFQNFVKMFCNFSILRRLILILIFLYSVLKYAWHKNL